MKVIVCGAGQVGFNIARYLASEGADITIIDSAADVVAKATETLDVQGIVGFAAHPDVLQRAGVEKADMLIAVTHQDEVNMVACQVAHALFDVPTKIARVRSQIYLKEIYSDLFSHDHLAIDVIISPEIEVARAIARRLNVPGSFDAIPLADGKLQLIGVRCTAETPILNTPLKQLTELFPDLHLAIVGIIRGNNGLVPSGHEMLAEGDEVYFLADTRHLARAMAAFGHEEKTAHRVVVLGGGNIGLYLAQMVERDQPDVSLKLVEYDKERAQFVAQSLERSVVINGSALDQEILEEAMVGQAETVVAVTNDDETNILASLLAKRQGCQRAVTLINKTTYGPLTGPLGIDTVVSPRAITVSQILRHVRRGRIRSVHSLAEGFGEVLEAEALETSSLIGVPIREASLPDGVHIGALIRDDEVIMAKGETVIKPHDLVVLFAAAGAVKRIEKLFAVKLEFF